MGLILVPAYGRDYTTASEVKTAWDANKDFQIASVGLDSGRYINKRDTETYGIEAGSYIRYKRLEELTFIGVWEEPEVDDAMDPDYIKEEEIA
jgi:hypothetical protein